MMTKILLIVSAFLGLIWALMVAFNACKKKTKEWPLALILLVAVVVLGLQASDLVNLKLIAGIVLACQFWIGLFMIFDGITKGSERPALSAAGGLVSAITAAWWLIITFTWVSILLAIGVIVATIVLFMFLLWLSRD